MAEVCRIPPQQTIYTSLLDALNQDRVWDAIVIYTSYMTDEHRRVLYAHYPVVYQVYHQKAAQYYK